MNTQRELFSKIPNFWAWACKFRVKIHRGIWGILSELSAPILALCVPCPCFPLIKHYFYKKQALIYPNYKYLFGIWILFLLYSVVFRLNVCSCSQLHTWFFFTLKKRPEFESKSLLVMSVCKSQSTFQNDALLLLVIQILINFYALTL